MPNSKLCPEKKYIYYHNLVLMTLVMNIHKNFDKNEKFQKLTKDEDLNGSSKNDFLTQKHI